MVCLRVSAFHLGLHKAFLVFAAKAMGKENPVAKPPGEHSPAVRLASALILGGEASGVPSLSLFYLTNCK
jgi:hypothetical protein